MDLIAYDDSRRPYLSMLATVLLALLAAVIGAAAVAVWHVSASAGTAKPSPAAPGARSSGCAGAIARADAALTVARNIESALATQTRTMNDLLAGRLTTGQALDRTLPGLARGSQQSMQFDEGLRIYADARKKCRLG